MSKYSCVIRIHTPIGSTDTITLALNGSETINNVMEWYDRCSKGCIKEAPIIIKNEYLHSSLDKTIMP